eukprot:261117-Pelagomonas_calceolata.AAC.1
MAHELYTRGGRGSQGFKRPAVPLILRASRSATGFLLTLSFHPRRLCWNGGQLRLPLARMQLRDPASCSCFTAHAHAHLRQLLLRLSMRQHLKHGGARDRVQQEHRVHPHAAAAPGELSLHHQTEHISALCTQVHKELRGAVEEQCKHQKGCVGLANMCICFVYISVGR